MMKRRGKTARAWGAAIAGTHFVVICGLASIVIREQHFEMAQEYWEYAGLFDFPASLVLRAFSPLLNLLSAIASWPGVSFLPGITGSWNRFLFPFLLYGVLGTAV
jgi:hypothetical protein